MESALNADMNDRLCFWHVMMSRQEWVVLGSYDLEEFVDEHLHTLSDWERNFKALKLRGRDAEKLPK